LSGAREAELDVSAHLARNLASLRAARGLSQADLGKKASLPAAILRSPCS
jgi:hypothetical protein